jgi:hypothetical protein
MTAGGANREAAAARARRTLARRRERIRSIRRAVATASIVVFVALFATIYLQMATGRDPVLGPKAAASASPDSGSESASNTASRSREFKSDGSKVESDDGSVTTGVGASATGVATPSPLPPVTTSQS